MSSHLLPWLPSNLPMHLLHLKQLRPQLLPDRRPQEETVRQKRTRESRRRIVTVSLSKRSAIVEKQQTSCGQRKRSKTRNTSAVHLLRGRGCQHKMKILSDLVSKADKIQKKINI